MDHCANAGIEFEISNNDMDLLKSIAPIDSYGEASGFPVYGKNARSN